MDYKELAKQFGSIATGEPITAADVQAELRSKSYVVQGGKLSPSELFRLKAYAKKRTIKRIVDEAFSADAAMVRRRPFAMARGTDPLYDRAEQQRLKIEAWAGFRAGPIR